MDALGQSLHDRRLADPCITDQHRIVLGPAAERLHHTPYLSVAAYNGVKTAVTGQPGQVHAVLFQSLVLAFGPLVGDALGSAHIEQRLVNPLLCDITLLERSAHAAADAVLG